jgi:hypothetical protein
MPIRSVLLAAALAALLAVPATASATRTLRAGRYGLTAMGAFHPQRDPSLHRAAEVFGRPLRLRPLGSTACRAYWPKLKLVILFANFGGGSACSGALGKAQSVTIGASPRWRTARGLKVGQTVAHLRRLHPRARRHGSRWWLAAATSQFGEGGRYAVLAARTSGGRVSGFAGWVGAAGE